jgi:hypothetical protein
VKIQGMKRISLGIGRLLGGHERLLPVAVWRVEGSLGQSFLAPTTDAVLPVINFNLEIGSGLTLWCLLDSDMDFTT